MPKAPPFFLPLRELWLAALPLMPLVALTVALSALFDPARELDFLGFDAAEFVAEPGRSYIHLGDMLTYYALAAVHVLVCLVAIGWYLGRMQALPAGRRRRAHAYLGSILALLVPLVVLFAVFANDSVIVQLGFKATCMALETAGLPTGLAGDGCFAAGEISKLTLLAWIPTFAGMGAVVFAAAAAHGIAGGLPPPGTPEWREAVDRRIDALEKAFYVLSAVLVSSTIAITLFARLPVGLLREESPLAGPMSAYAIGLSTFWGALFTLTLAATFAGAVWQIVQSARGATAAETVADPSDLRLWLREHVFVSIRKQLANVVGVLAPLLVGPLSSLLSTLAGG